MSDVAVRQTILVRQADAAESNKMDNDLEQVLERNVPTEYLPAALCSEYLAKDFRHAIPQ